MKRTLVLIAVSMLTAVSVFAQTREEAVRKTLNERYEAAEADLKALIAKDPSNGDLYFAAGDNYFYWEDLAAAESMHRKGKEVAPLNPLNFVGLGRVTYMQGDTVVTKAQFAEAQKIMETKSNKIDKQVQVLAYSKMAEVYLVKGKENLPAALALLSKAQVINDALANDKKNLEFYILLGDYYWRRDGMNLSQAIMEYNKALAINPKYVPAIVRKGVVYKSSDNPNAARDMFNEAIAIDPTFAPAYREKAELIYQQLTEQAIEAYAKYLELNNSCRVQQRYAAFVFYTKDYKRAVPELEKALPCNTENAIMYRLLGYAYYETGDIAKSKENLDKFFAMARSKGKPTIMGSDYGYLGKLQAKAGEDSLALLTFQEAMKLDTSYIDGYSDMAMIYQKQKRYDKAAELYAMKIAMSEKPAPLDYFYLGTTSYHNKQYATSDSIFALIEKNYDDSHFWRGRAKNRMEIDPNAPTGLAKPHYEEFIRQITTKNKVEANKKNLIEAYTYLAIFHGIQLNYDCAKVAWTKVMELDPANPNAKIALEDKNIIAAAGTCELIPLAPVEKSPDGELVPDQGKN